MLVVPTTFSEALGFTSMAMWLGAQFPQILQNIRLQSCDGLALPFLFNWFLGDFSNLIGCLLTNQLPFQLYLAMYFVSVDFILLGQYVYYSRKKVSSEPAFRRHSVDRQASRYRTLSAVAAVAAATVLASEDRRVVDGSTSVVSDEEPDMTASFHSERAGRKTWATDSASGRRVASVGPRRSTIVRGRSMQRVDDTADTQRSLTRTSKRNGSMVFLALFALIGYGAFPTSYPAVVATHTGRVLEGGHASHLVAYAAGVDERVVGRIFAWLCATLYLTSRMPQIWKNYARKSVEGLTRSMFIFAFLGNTFYVSSILTSPRMAEGAVFLRESIPYLLGSGGTLMFDVTIVCQHLIYSGRSPHVHHRRHSTAHTNIQPSASQTRGRRASNTSTADLV